MAVKLVIVIRDKYPQEKGVLSLRKGKFGAQCCHAGGAFMRAKRGQSWSAIEEEWAETGHTTIVLGVESEEQLLQIHEQSLAAGLNTFLITDRGTTEFHGVPTNTAIGIGPDLTEKIDPITGHLKLL